MLRSGPLPCEAGEGWGGVLLARSLRIYSPPQRIKPFSRHPREGGDPVTLLRAINSPAAERSSERSRGQAPEALAQASELRPQSSEGEPPHI